MSVSAADVAVAVAVVLVVEEFLVWTVSSATDSQVRPFRYHRRRPSHEIRAS